MDFAVVIPCWNEAATIGSVVARARAQGAAVYVVDDGSADASAEVARSGGATVLLHTSNQGKGAALRTGLEAADAAGFAWAFTLDGDGQHEPADMPRFLAAADKADLLIGNRMGTAEAMPPIRRFVNWWMSRQLARRIGQPCPDSQCGFRLIRLAAWRQAPLSSRWFEIESEMLVAFAARGFRIGFIPVACLPSPRPSRIGPWRDSVRWFRWWFFGPDGKRRLRNTSPPGKTSPALMTDLPQPSAARRLAKAVLIPAARLLIVGLLLGWLYAWASPWAYPKEKPLGFTHGFLHGGLMPMAFPSLVLGQEVEIFAPNNTGRFYKMGYICGINFCGLIFFGLAFARPSNKKPQ